MSHVTGVTLQISLGEEANIAVLNEWLEAHSFGHLASVDNAYGGSKHPQVLVYGGGYNYLNESDFIKIFRRIKWESPLNAVLLMNPEEGPTKIVRARK